MHLNHMIIFSASQKGLLSHNNYNSRLSPNYFNFVLKPDITVTAGQLKRNEKEAVIKLMFISKFSKHRE